MMIIVAITLLLLFYGRTLGFLFLFFFFVSAERRVVLLSFRNCLLFPIFCPFISQLRALQIQFYYLVFRHCFEWFSVNNKFFTFKCNKNPLREAQAHILQYSRRTATIMMLVRAWFVWKMVNLLCAICGGGHAQVCDAYLL